MSEARPSMAEVFAVLNQLVEAYGQVMATFGSVVDDVQQLRHEMAELRKLMEDRTANAVTAVGIWRNVADAHALKADELRAALAELTAQLAEIKRNGQ